MAPTRRTAFLTDDFVCALQPPTDTTQIIVWDAPDPGIPGSAGIFVPGLGIRVTAGGVRAFVLDYRIDGVQRRPKIGRAPPWTVDRARRRAIEWRTKIDNGIDVRGERRSKRARIAAERDREAKELTMRQLAERFERSYIPTKRPRTAEGYKSQLKVHVLPSKIADLPISQITVADISELHTEASTGALSGRPAPTQANRTVTMLHRMFELARVWGLTPPGFVNPARTALRGTNEGGVVRNEEHPRERYPTEEEMGAIKAALDRHPIQRNADAIRMLVLTGCRRNEILTATWSDIDFGKSIWNRPAIRQKGKKNHSAAGTAGRAAIARHP